MINSRAIEPLVLSPVKELQIMIFKFVSVELVGGSSSSEGNVHAKNPVTGIYGPVCDDGFDINAVS